VDVVGHLDHALEDLLNGLVLPDLFDDLDLLHALAHNQLVAEGLQDGAVDGDVHLNRDLHRLVDVVVDELLNHVLDRLLDVLLVDDGLLDDALEGNVDDALNRVLDDALNGVLDVLLVDDLLLDAVLDRSLNDDIVGLVDMDLGDDGLFNVDLEVLGDEVVGHVVGFVDEVDVRVEHVEAWLADDVGLDEGLAAGLGDDVRAAGDHHRGGEAAGGGLGRERVALAHLSELSAQSGNFLVQGSNLRVVARGVPQRVVLALEVDQTLAEDLHILKVALDAGGAADELVSDGVGESSLGQGSLLFSDLVGLLGDVPHHLVGAVLMGNQLGQDLGDGLALLREQLGVLQNHGALGRAASRGHTKAASIGTGSVVQ